MNQRETARKRIGELSERIAQLKESIDGYETRFARGAGDAYDSDVMHDLYAELRPLYAERFTLCRYLRACGEGV